MWLQNSSKLVGCLLGSVIDHNISHLFTLVLTNLNGHRSNCVAIHGLPILRKWKEKQKVRIIETLLGGGEKAIIINIMYLENIAVYAIK